MVGEPVAPRTIDLVLDEPRRQLSPTILQGIRHDLRQPQHIHAMLLRTLRLRAAGTIVEGDVADLANAARVLLERYEAAVLTLGASIEAPVARNSSVSLANVMESVEMALAPIAEEAGVALRVARTRLWGYTDPEMVGRIMSNLVSNAIAHSQGDKVLLSARSRFGRLQIEVRDNGIGVPEHEVPWLCEPGFRGSTSINPGLGLGLYNVQLLATALGGRVRIVAHPDRGTRVRVTTGSYCGPAHEAHRTRADPMGPLTGQRIMVTSHDPVTRQLIGKAFQDAGATVADYPDVLTPALELPYWPGALDGFVIDGNNDDVEQSFVQGLGLRFGELRGVQILSRDALFASPPPKEILRVLRPLSANSLATMIQYFTK